MDNENFNEQDTSSNLRMTRAIFGLWGAWEDFTTDLKYGTGSSIYCWETEANGGHIGVTTWRVQWRHRKENKDSDIFN